MRRSAAFLIAAVAFPPAPAATLEGNWETVISSPRRPWNFTTHFERTGNAWKGVMSIHGYGDLPLSGVEVRSDRIHFAFPPELDSLVFEGGFRDSDIVGQVVEAGRPVPTTLTRLVALPEPASRLEAWRQDLDCAVKRMNAYERSFTPQTREAFTNTVAKLESGLPHENDSQILTGLARAVALAGNAHTRLRLDPTRQGAFTTEFPLVLWSFKDGIYVVRAAPSCVRALRCRLVAIDGVGIEEVTKQVGQTFAGNPSWTEYLGPIYMMKPDVLYGLGLIQSPDQATLTLMDEQGTKLTLLVRAVLEHRDTAPAESWMALSPVTKMGTPPWVPALPADATLPLYLRHPDRAYWFDFAPETGLLYFQFNRSGNDDSGPSFQAFADSMLAVARARPVKDMVIDLRLNSGGNLDVAKSFMKSLGDEPHINRAGHLFVITGHNTFSAAIYHAAQLKQFTHATFVGEPVGDRLDFWAEGGNLVLPHSQAVIHYSNGFHRYSGRDDPGNKPYFEELSVPTLAPDLPAVPRSTDYFSLRDPSLEAIASRLRQ